MNAFIISLLKVALRLALPIPHSLDLIHLVSLKRKAHCHNLVFPSIFFFAIFNETKTVFFSHVFLFFFLVCFLPVFSDNLFLARFCLFFLSVFIFCFFPIQENR